MDKKVGNICGCKGSSGTIITQNRLTFMLVNFILHKVVLITTFKKGQI